MAMNRRRLLSTGIQVTSAAVAATALGGGSGKTPLYATKSLTELIGVYGSRYGGDKSSWSWAGGLVWMCPADRYQTLTDAIRTQAWPFEGFTGNKRDEFTVLAHVTAE